MMYPNICPDGGTPRSRCILSPRSSPSGLFAAWMHFVSAKQSSTNVTWTEPEVRDNSDMYTVWSSHHPGDAFKIGTTPVTYSAIDSSGNVKTITFNITVVGKV